MVELKRDGEKERGEARKAYCEVLAVKNKSSCQPWLPILLKILFFLKSLLLSVQPRLASCPVPRCLCGSSGSVSTQDHLRWA